jgi:hypothetical protein
VPTYQSIWTHRKTFELAALLGLNETYAAAHLIRLCTWAIDNAPDGDLSGLSDRAIAYGAGWTQEVSLFVRALVTSGFLDEGRTIHDWHDYAGRLVERRVDDAERKRKMRETSAGQAPDVRRTSNGLSGVVRRREQDSTEQEKGVHRSTSPQPPPQAEGERQKGGTNLSADLPTLVPLTDADAALWAAAKAAATDGLLPANAERIEILEPLGRAPNGGLYLRAPPGWSDARMSLGAVRAALVHVGDADGKHAAIVTG